MVSRARAPPPRVKCRVTAALAFPRTQIRGQIPWRLIRARRTEPTTASATAAMTMSHRDNVGKREHDRGDASRWSSRDARGMTSPYVELRERKRERERGERGGCASRCERDRASENREGWDIRG